MTAKALIKRLRQDGWIIIRVSESHHVFKHPSKPGRVIIPLHGKNRDMPTGTLLHILKQAGLL